MRWVCIFLTLFAVSKGESETLKVTTILTTGPYTRNASDGQLVGFIPDFIAKLAEKVGFKYELHLVKDDRYGTAVGEPTAKQWTGMVGELTRHEADIAAADLTVTSMRQKACRIRQRRLISAAT